MDRVEEVVAALRGVADPCCRERGISVIDMGLLQDIAVDDHGVAQVRIVLTSGWCPFQVDLLEEITAAVESVPGVESATVSIDLREAWSTERLSDDARGKLRFLPEPTEVADRDAYRARALPIHT